nr:ubiquitin hydrolase [Tanacetum cinerariifolium]
MSWTGLPEFADDTITDYNRPSPSIEKVDCAKVKTNKGEAARKPSIKYAEMYRNTSKSPKVRAEAARKPFVKYAEMYRNTTKSPKARVYSPPKKDMSWTGLPEFADDTITDYNRPSPSIEKVDCAKVKTNKGEAARKPSIKYAEMYRNTSKSPKVRGNQRNWNNLKTQQLGKDFLMKNKACFKCDNFDHLAYDCVVWVEKGKIWRKSNFAHKNVTPRADLFKIASVSTARRVNTAAPRPNEIKFCEKIRGLEFDVKNKNTKIENLMNELEQIKKEKEGLDRKLTGFESASKDLDTLLGSQRSDKKKEGLEYSVVPPYAQVYSPPKKDMSWTEHGESSESIISKPMIKFVKAADCAEVKTNKAEAARKPSIKYAEMYRNTSKSPKVRGKTWRKNNFAHKNVTPRANLFKIASVSAARRVNTAATRPNVNSARLKTTQDLVEARLVEFKTREIKFCEKIRGLEFDVKNKNTKIENLMNELEQIKKEKEHLDSKLTSFESASKDLDTLLRSHRSDKNKEGLGYNVVLPPAQVYSPLKKDMSWTGLPEFADDTITDYNRPSLSIESNSSDL